MFHQKSFIAITAFAIFACSGESPIPSDSTSVLSNDKHVEIALSDKLDGVTNHYCIDIAGGNKNVNIENGLQAHTCYSYTGELGTDQIFDESQFSDNVLYMPIYDVCASLESFSAGAELELNSCDKSELQSFLFSGEGLITPTSAPSMCLTAAAETRFGRAKIHQIKNLSLEVCSDSLSAQQTWLARVEQD